MKNKSLTLKEFNALYTLDKKLTRAGLIMTQRGSNYRIR